MDHHEIKDRLNDFVDGLVAPEQRGEVERHIEVCDACRAEVAALRALLADASALPRSVAPPRDLWPEIADAIVQPHVIPLGFSSGVRHSSWSKWGAVAAAAVVLVAVSSLLTAFWLSRTSDVPVAHTSPPFGARFAGAETDLQAVVVAYTRVIDDLYGVLKQRRHTFTPETARIIDENLRIIDEAIWTLNGALAANPGDRQLIRRVSAMYEQKVGLLQKAASLPVEL